MKNKSVIQLLLLSSCITLGVTGCTTMGGTKEGKVVVPTIAVSNNINTSPMIGPATETITINGKQIPQFSKVLVDAPISAHSPVTIYYNGSYPCQKGGCTMPLQLPVSCYATSGKVFINGMLTYNVIQGYFIQGLYCTPYQKHAKQKAHHHNS